uniref:Mobile element protein n=1 Tax=Klebsiella pneumoniae TaxID=573 RepID=A0A857AX28_KLEPN|nr:Mobile element protein [Klebsiella pneumoniae]
MHLAVDSNTHEIICADLSLNNVTDSEAFPVLSGRLTENQGSIGRRRLRHPALSR